jgi:hypothetical protein
VPDRDPAATVSGSLVEQERIAGSPRFVFDGALCRCGARADVDAPGDERDIELARELSAKRLVVVGLGAKTVMQVRGNELDVKLGAKLDEGIG